VIDPDAVRRQIAARLPPRVRWQVGPMTCLFDFSRSAAPLRPITADDVTGCPIEDAWTAIDLFGEQVFADGGGASPLLGVDRQTGEVCGLDVEREPPQMFLLNSSVDRFLETFRLFDEALRLGTRSLDEVVAAAREIDPAAFERSEWRSLCEYLDP
jgi:hypothetical protein